MRSPGIIFRSESQAVLLELAKTEANARVVASLCYAFAHLDVEDRIPLMRRASTYIDIATRMAATYGLNAYDHEEAIPLLITLSTDNDDEIRDWATFALGTQTERDSPALRDALLARTNDPHLECRHEAIIGLAKRKDERVLRSLREVLNMKEVWCLAIEAASELGSSELFPLLLALKSDSQDNSCSEELEIALKNCRETGANNSMTNLFD